MRSERAQAVAGPSLRCQWQPAKSQAHGARPSKPVAAEVDQVQEDHQAKRGRRDQRRLIAATKPVAAKASARAGTAALAVTNKPAVAAKPPMMPAVAAIKQAMAAALPAVRRSLRAARAPCRRPPARPARRSRRRPVPCACRSSLQQRRQPQRRRQQRQQPTSAGSRVSQRHGFKTSEWIVQYPAHGVGRIVGIEE